MGLGKSLGVGDHCRGLDKDDRNPDVGSVQPTAFTSREVILETSID